MCGIVGVVSARGEIAEEVVDRQVELLHHRGPDSSGRFGGRRGIVAQNRLAVIDLVTGDPPLTNEDGTVGVALNGEIYNYRALRDRLLAGGHTLRSRGDTEVIAHLAEDLPPVELGEALDGMFAFAVWDERRERLVLGRDRFGKKPLYYWTGNGTFVFASEIKGILAHPAVPRRLAPAAIPAYLTFGYVPSPKTFFEGIRSVPPGHVLTVEPGEAPSLARYWEPPVRRVSAQPLDLPLDEAARLVRATLTRSVEERLVSDVPLGAFLSGGIDSSAVVGLMSGLVDRPVKTFTIGFDDRDGYDERPYARIVAERFGTDHTEFVVKPDAVELLERLLWHHDQPFGDSSAIPTFLLSELTRGHVTVALCGDGGDELFAGYERFLAGLAARRYRRLPGPARSVARRAVDALPRTWLGGRVASLQRFATRADAGLPDAYAGWLAYLPEETRRAVLRQQDDWALEEYRRVWAASEGAEPLDRLLDLNIRTYLLDDLLPKMDRMSMAHALEVRAPFLDRELAELALRLPPGHKVARLRLKRVLKEAVSDLLPAEILGRGKRGFGVPLDRWFRTDLAPYVRSMLGSNGSRVRAHLVPEPIDGLLAEHASGARNHGPGIWALLTLEAFLRREGW
jgi:asparagine synthase (glutamine-hydrolysing)